MEKNCKTSVVPTVDNSSSDCSECGFFKDLCILMSEDVTYLGVKENETLKTFINKLILDIKKKTRRISDLESAVKDLTDRVTALEP